MCSQACSSLPDEGIFPDHHVTESVLGAAYRSHTSVGSSRDRHAFVTTEVSERAQVDAGEQAYNSYG